jgi:hypothetical protein
MDRAESIADNWLRNNREDDELDFWLAYQDLQRRLKAKGGLFD